MQTMKYRQTHHVTVVSAVAAVIFCMATAHAQNSVLHEFAGTGDGANPRYGSLALSGGNLYGTTSGGGAYNSGTVYQMGTDGSNYKVLYSFTGDTDGANPQAGPILGGSTLYGTTYYGGIGSSFNGLGTVYKINTDGTGFSALHAFTYAEAGRPWTSLTLSGNTLFGITYYTVTGFPASVFSMNTDGTSFATLHTFSTSEQGGKGPMLVRGNVLYGTMDIGGPSGGGAVFKMNTDGTGYSVLRAFGGTFEDGGGLNGTLTLSGDTLYGTTLSGGVIGGFQNQGGTIYNMKTDGTEFQTIHTFPNGADGKYPAAGLTLIGTTLYGTTSQGGTGGAGTVFQVETDGSGYNVLSNFSGSNGRTPLSDLTTDGSMLYGTTYQGGSANSGIIFSLAVPEPASTSLMVFGVVSLAVTRRSGLRTRCRRHQPQ